MAGGYTQSGRGGADEAWPLVEATWKRSAPRIDAATLILWAKNDNSVMVEVGEALQEALSRAGKPRRDEGLSEFRKQWPRAVQRRQGILALRPRRRALPGRSPEAVSRAGRNEH